MPLTTSHNCKGQFGTSSNTCRIHWLPYAGATLEYQSLNLCIEASGGAFLEHCISTISDGCGVYFIMRFTARSCEKIMAPRKSCHMAVAHGAQASLRAIALLHVASFPGPTQLGTRLDIYGTSDPFSLPMASQVTHPPCLKLSRTVLRVNDQQSAALLSSRSQLANNLIFFCLTVPVASMHVLLE